MLKPLLLNLLFFIVAITLCNSAVAQSSPDTTANGHALYANIEENFYKVIGPQSRLYSGERFDGYSPAIKGNAYLLDNDQPSSGNVLYDGFWYKNVNMLYDLYKDQLITSLYNSF